VNEIEVSGCDVVYKAQYATQPVQKTERASITANEWNQLLHLVQETEFLKLNDRYGCPDCADQGGEWIEIRFADGKTKKVTFDYNRPPEEILEIVKKLQAIQMAFDVGPALPSTTGLSPNKPTPGQCGEAGLPESVVTPASDIASLYPKEHLAQFVTEMLDVTSFPSSFGPGRIKGKYMFKDYGLVVRKLTEKEAVLEVEDGGWRYRVGILERTDAGIFVCFEDQARNGGSYHAQSVLFLDRSDKGSLLMGHETKTTFSDCPPFAR